VGALRTWLSSAGHGDLWWYARRRGEIEIAPLVSPLRFDVTVRQSFFAFLSAHRDLYADDFERFASEARRHDYFIWFRDIMCVAWQPHVLADGTSFDRAWEERLHATAALQD
jgi:hypothetical protein